MKKYFYSSHGEATQFFNYIQLDVPYTWNDFLYSIHGETYIVTNLERVTLQDVDKTP